MFYDRVRQTTTSTGSGELQLNQNTSVPTGYRSFISAWNGPVTDPVRVAIVHATLDEWEICDVTIAAGAPPSGPDIVTRGAAVARSVGAGDNVDFSAGEKHIFPVTDAEWLNGANGNRRVFSVRVLAEGTALTVADGLGVFAVPAELNGYNIISAVPWVDTPSSSGLPQFQLHNLSNTADIFSTRPTIDEGEYDAYDPATPGVIDTDQDHLATGDRIRFDCDAAGTGTAGLGFHFICEKP